jgi:hypothetical protein
MGAYELHDLLVDHRGLIANTWQFFVSVHLALLGLAFVVRFHDAKLVLRLLMFTGYAGFMYINFMAQLDNYRYAAALLNALVEEASGETPAIRAMHLLFRPGWILDYLHVIYLGSMVLGALAIFIPAFTARARTRAEEDASVLVM